MKNEIYMAVHSAALERDDRRPVAVIHAVERVLPAVRLDWTVTDDRQIVQLPRRDEWLAQATREGTSKFLCNNDESSPVVVSGIVHPAGCSPGRAERYEFYATLTFDPGHITPTWDVFEGLAEAARADWGNATPGLTGAEVADQMIRSANGPAVSPHGLPMLKLPWHLPSPVIPYYLGWLNYWSAAAAQAIGFPDPARDTELLSRARRTASGGWIVQLTEEPLDYDNPAHIEALKRTYERFPVIGGRSLT